MEEKQGLIFITILLMGLVTYIPRTIPMLVSSSYWPGWLKDIIEYLPVAIVGAITIPAIFIKEQRFIFFSSEIVASIVCLLIAYYSKNLILTVICGTILYIILNNFL